MADLERSYKRVSVGQVVGDANRAVRPLGRPAALRGVRGVVAGFRWAKGDDEVSYWYPQGITGSADASPSGSWDGRRVLLVSWYSKRQHGVRVSFVRADRLGDARYRHALLVVPDGRGGFGPVKVHAGGIAWVGRYLYVADTSRGLRVFDLDHILRVPDGRLSRSLDYRYVVPQVGAYRNIGAALRYSFVSVDRSAGQLSLITGEWRPDGPGGRLVRWRLDPAGGLVSQAAAQAAWRSPRVSMQGALSIGGRLVVSSSRGGSGYGTLAWDRARGSGVAPWARGPEDLSYAATTGRIYALTEYPGARAVFAIRASSLR